MRISDWSSDVCSSDLGVEAAQALGQGVVEGAQGAGAPEGVAERGVVHGDGFSRSDTPSPQPLSRTRERGSGSRGEGRSEPPETSASRAWRSEERREGNECLSPCNSRVSLYPQKKTKQQQNH